ncbi:MBL fold metallo-hydrolase [Deinococcus navajonensis]|uniref:MBL fold metallo-hydrolase n=1 Tax=Deinococcus navajonensis TaxID=309884 RepID=A0ABV8XPA8_9DEIO
MTLAVRTLYANVFLLDTPDGRLLVDAGALPYARRFARIVRDFRPDALLVTHAHLDHAGGAFVAARQGMPVLAHPLEHPQLSGQRHALPYPAGHPWLGSAVSRLHPKVAPVHLHSVYPGERVRGWEVVALPGHTAGQIGVLRDGVLIAADAVVGGADGAHLPRAEYNSDHVQANRTLEAIAAMDLRRIWPGHGGPLAPEQVRTRARRDAEAAT